MSQYGLPVADANTLVGEASLRSYFEDTVSAGAPARKAANWVINNLVATLADKETALEDCPVQPPVLAGLIGIVEEGIVSNNQAREVLDYLWQHPDTPAAEAAAKLGYKKADSGALEALVDTVLAENPDLVELVKGGNMKLANALTGKVMKVSNPKPNPKLVTEIILSRLGLS